VRALAGLAAGILALIGYPAYLRGVAAGRIQPALASWWAWFTSALIVMTAQIGSASGWGMSTSVAQTFGLGAVLVVAGRRQRPHMDPADLVCIALGVTGAAVGVLVRSPDVAVAAAIAGNLVAGIPTYRSVLRHPEREAPTLWLCCGIAGGLTAWAAPTFTVADAGYGVYLLIADLSIGLAACRRPRPRPERSSESSPRVRDRRPLGI
jgi:hypothetical protein